MGARVSNASGGLLLLVALVLVGSLESIGTASGAQQAPQSKPDQSTPASTSTPASASSNVDNLPVSLDRIREQLAREPAFSVNLLRALDIPVFRTETKSDLVFRPDPNYWKDDDVGAYVRPSVNRWQYDFMKMTNPNLPTGYGPGGGADVLPAIQSAFSAIRHGFQSRDEARVRQQIKDELRQINEQRRADGLPPLEDTAPTQPRQPDQP